VCCRLGRGGVYAGVCYLLVGGMVFGYLGVCFGRRERVSEVVGLGIVNYLKSRNWERWFDILSIFVVFYISI